ncbi:MAG TPA: lipoprotein-releasing ABC transporter permease subunit [Vicinamibacterales bacterium]|jgi:lipoprotein-releasing system permease protein
MNIPFELHIALRYLLAKRKQAFISVISAISTLGVAVGVMAVVIALAIMTGLQQELRDRILGSSPHIYVVSTDGFPNYREEIARLRKTPHVVGAAPAILGRALISALTRTQPVEVKGIDPALEPGVTDLQGAMRTGSLDALDPRDENDFPGVLIGKDLASTLGVGVGDSVNLTTPEGILTPTGRMPYPRRLRVAGTFSLGLYELDTTMAYVSIATARRLFAKDQVDVIQLRVDDIWRAPEIARELEKSLGPGYSTQDWAAMNRSLFSALWLEKIAVSLAIGLIVMVAALNIIASLILLVMEKNRDIAILKTMGASARSVTVIFLLQGVIIGVVGTIVGGTLGVLVSRVMDRYQLIRMPVDVYQVSHLPFKVLPTDLLLVVTSAIFICFIATLYPSRQAARLDPAQALRYE